MATLLAVVVQCMTPVSVGTSQPIARHFARCTQSILFAVYMHGRARCSKVAADLQLTIYLSNPENVVHNPLAEAAEVHDAPC